MLQLGEAFAQDERAASDDGVVRECYEDFVIRNERRCKCEIGLPLVDPLRGIIPMPLGRVGQRGELI